MSGAAALERGFRLQVPGTQLWFNVQPDLWAEVHRALEGFGCEFAQDGMSGDEVCQGGGMSVTYSAEAGRLRAELLDSAGEAGIARYLEALRALVPPPDAEASACWLWGTEPFAVAGSAAEAAQRVMRGARWRAGGGDAPEVLGAAAEVAAAVGDLLTMHVSVGAMCVLDVASPPEVRGPADLRRRASAFGTLITRLGSPERADYATVRGMDAEG